MPRSVKSFTSMKSKIWNLVLIFPPARQICGQWLYYLHKYESPIAWLRELLQEWRCTCVSFVKCKKTIFHSLAWFAIWVRQFSHQFKMIAKCCITCATIDKLIYLYYAVHRLGRSCERLGDMVAFGTVSIMYVNFRTLSFFQSNWLGYKTWATHVWGIDSQPPAYPFEQTVDNNGNNLLKYLPCIWRKPLSQKIWRSKNFTRTNDTKN